MAGYSSLPISLINPAVSSPITCLACTQLPKHIFPGLLYKRYYGSVSLLATVPGILPHPGSLLITKHRLYCRVNVYIYLLVFDPALLLHPLPQNAHHH